MQHFACAEFHPLLSDDTPVPPVWVAWAVWAACIKAQSVIRNAGDFPGVFMYDYQEIVAFSERATKWLGCQQRRENVAHRDVVAHLLSVVILCFFLCHSRFSTFVIPVKTGIHWALKSK